MIVLSVGLVMIWNLPKAATSCFSCCADSIARARGAMVAFAPRRVAPIARTRGAMVAFAPRRVAPIAPGIAPEGVQKAGGAIQNSPTS
jgi:hypothetical protein